VEVSAVCFLIPGDMGAVMGIPFDNTSKWTIDGCIPFADAVTKAQFDTPEFHTMIETASAADFSKWNITSVGNIAYMAKHCASPCKEQAQALFDAFCKWKNEEWVQKQLSEQAILNTSLGSQAM